MKALFCLILGIVVGAVAYYFIATNPRTRTTASNPLAIQAQTNTAATNQAAEEHPSEYFNTDKIKDELSRTGKVIREKSKQAGHVIADATADARTTAAIKTKLIKDSGLSAFKIDVNTTAGTVTLAGTVSSYDEIVKVMRIALETHGVQRVISTLQVKG